MHTKALPAGSRQILAELKKSASTALQGWILAGGTGLALHAYSYSYRTPILIQFGHLFLFKADTRSD